MASSPQSFEEFVRVHGVDLYRTAVLVTWDDSEAEDLVQECLLRLSRRWRRVRAMDMPLAYARRIVINLALSDRQRRAHRLSEIEWTDAEGFDGKKLIDASAETALVSLSDRAELDQALGQLTPHQRAVLVLRYFHDLSEAQAAELLGCGTGTVKSSASRGLTRLRVLMSTPTPTAKASK